MRKSDEGNANLKLASALRRKMVLPYTRSNSPYAVWYECIHGEYAIYQNDGNGCAELLLRTEKQDEMTGFMYLLILLRERGEKFLSSRCIMEVLKN